jgi:hypothetical protein
MRVQGERIVNKVEAQLALTLKVHGMALATPKSLAHQALLKMEKKGWVKLIVNSNGAIQAESLVIFEY